MIFVIENSGCRIHYGFANYTAGKEPSGEHESVEDQVFSGSSGLDQPGSDLFVSKPGAYQFV